MKKLSFLLVLFLLTFSTLPVHAQETAVEEIKVDAVQPKTGVSLKIDPPLVAMAKGDEVIKLMVIMSPASKTVKAFDIVLTYNPQNFEVLNITPTDATKTMNEINKNIDNEAGVVTYSLGVPLNNPDSALVTTEGAIAEITARTKENGNSELAFDTKKTVIATKEDASNALGETQNTTIRIGTDENGSVPKGIGEASEQSGAPSGTPSVIPMVIAGGLFCFGLVVFVIFFLRKPPTQQ